MLATSADLQTLVEAKQNRTALNIPILHGWRRQLAGDLLLQVLDGAVTVSVDRMSGALRMTAGSTSNAS
jgi:ribonuclease D